MRNTHDTRKTGFRPGKTRQGWFEDLKGRIYSCISIYYKSRYGSDHCVVSPCDHGRVALMILFSLSIFICFHFFLSDTETRIFAKLVESCEFVKSFVKLKKNYLNTYTEKLMKIRESLDI